MKTNDSVLHFKKYIKKKRSQDLAIKLKMLIENKYPDDKRYIKKMERQLKCINRFDEYDNGDIKSFYCYQKTCPICNSNRLSNFLNRHLEIIEKQNCKYHMVLTIKNPSKENLKVEIEKMFKFFNQSSLKRNNKFLELNKKIKFIRSFESTLNSKQKSFNIHFHILLAGENEKEIKEYGKIIINYWLKYFKEKAHKNAQYLEKQLKSPLENFKYLIKTEKITESNLEMFYHLLKAIDYKRLFTSKNFKRNEIVKNKNIENIAKNKINYLQSFLFNKNKLTNEINWISENSGEIFITEEKEKLFINDIKEKRNLLELKKYFQSHKRFN